MKEGRKRGKREKEEKKRTRPSRPIRCDVWIVEGMRYPTDRQTDRQSEGGGRKYRQKGESQGVERKPRQKQ